jgi:tryptophanyl-tRNA synthetase
MRFNHRFGETFVIPKAVTPPIGARVMDLQDPTSKMSKSTESDAGCVYLLDSPEAIMKKFKRAVTDSDSEVIYDREKKPGVSNLLDILSASTGTAPQALAGQYSQYGKLKSDCGEAVVSILQPIQARYTNLISDPSQLHEMLSVGAIRAEAIAQKTLQRAQQAIGMTPRR